RLDCDSCSRLYCGEGRNRMRLTSIVALGLVLCCCIAVASEGQSHGRKYKWKDGEGNVHYADDLPSEAIKYGYDVINAEGLLVKHVDRAKTPDELKAEEAAAAAKAAAQKASDEEAQRDKQMLAAYPNEEDLVKSQQQHLDGIDQNIHATELSLANQ